MPRKLEFHNLHSNMFLLKSLSLKRAIKDAAEFTFQYVST